MQARMSKVRVGKSSLQLAISLSLTEYMASYSYYQLPYIVIHIKISLERQLLYQTRGRTNEMRVTSTWFTISLILTRYTVQLLPLPFPIAGTRSKNFYQTNKLRQITSYYRGSRVYYKYQRGSRTARVNLL